MTDALLFDYNGVITDDEEQHRATFADLLAEAGIALSRDQYYAEYLGCDDRTSFVQAFHRAGKPLDPIALQALVARKSQAYARLTGTAPPLVPGAAAFVRAASGRFRMGLVSGAQRREIEPGLATVEAVHIADSHSQQIGAGGGNELGGPGRVGEAGGAAAFAAVLHGRASWFPSVDLSRSAVDQDVDAAHDAPLRAYRIRPYCCASMRATA